VAEGAGGEVDKRVVHHIHSFRDGLKVMGTEKVIGTGVHVVGVR
jgi:hypothetical protein